MREKHQLHDKVELLGPVRHSDVRNVIINKNFFLAGIFLTCVIFLGFMSW